MLIRVSGKLTDGRTFAIRTDADNSIAALVAAREKLNKSGVADTLVGEFKVVPVAGQDDVYISKVEDDEKVPATASAPAGGKAQGKK
jgi:hypothetical protein